MHTQIALHVIFVQVPALAIIPQPGHRQVVIRVAFRLDQQLLFKMLFPLAILEPVAIDLQDKLLLVVAVLGILQELGIHSKLHNTVAQIFVGNQFFPRKQTVVSSAKIFHNIHIKGKILTGGRILIDKVEFIVVRTGGNRELSADYGFQRSIGSGIVAHMPLGNTMIKDIGLTVCGGTGDLDRLFRNGIATLPKDKVFGIGLAIFDPMATLIFRQGADVQILAVGSHLHREGFILIQTVIPQHQVRNDPLITIGRGMILPINGFVRTFIPAVSVIIQPANSQVWFVHCRRQISILLCRLFFHNLSGGFFHNRLGGFLHGFLHRLGYCLRDSFLHSFRNCFLCGFCHRRFRGFLRH